MSKDLQFFLPLTIPLWGIVEVWQPAVWALFAAGVIADLRLSPLMSLQPSHVHINYHMNFAFHVDDGRIIGVTAYPGMPTVMYYTAGTVMLIMSYACWSSAGSISIRQSR